MHVNWTPDIAGELPAPRDDEPASLRQDIADELADHLRSSFTRELHSTPEETTARQNVLDRFGDPRRVARQLWFDAMKEKLMSQRVNLVLSSLMTAACLGALGIMAFTLRESHNVNAAILERLQALATPQPIAPPAHDAADAGKSMDWVRLKFNLVAGERRGLPAVGFRVQIQNAGGMGGGMVLGETEKDGRILTGIVEESTGADGVAELGLFRFGSYSVTATSPWGEFTTRQIGLRPGQEPIREIVCPVARPDEADVAFAVDWPDDLKSQRLWLLCRFAPASRRVGTGSWSLNHPPRTAFSGVNGRVSDERLIINADGKNAAREVAWANQSTYGGMVGTAQGEDARINILTPSHFDDTFRFPALNLTISTVTIVKPNDAYGSHPYPVLAQFTPYPGGMGGGMMGMGSGMMGGGGGGFYNVFDPDEKSRPSAIREGHGFSFEPKPGQVNRWTISLPDEVLDRVRVKLKLIPDPEEQDLESDDAPGNDR